MKSETRANIIFLAIFLAISLPGAAILFKKKLDPSAAPMYLPDPIHQRLPYMAPQWTPDEVRRVIPLLTGQWVEQINREQGAGKEMLLHNRLPLISNDRMLQVTAMHYTQERLNVYAIVWESEDEFDAVNYKTSISTGTATQPGRVVAVRKIMMPMAVRNELMNEGYVKPSQFVSWFELQFDGFPPDQASFTLHLSCQKGSASWNRSVNLFTQ
jgi:hypothetical protein